MAEDNWRDSDLAQSEEMRPTLKTAMFPKGEGESAIVTFEDDGEQQETEYGEAVKFFVQFEEFNGIDTTVNLDDDEEEPAEGEAGSVFTSSTPLLSALAQLDVDSLEGKTVEISRHGQSFDTTYEATIIE